MDSFKILLVFLMITYNVVAASSQQIPTTLEGPFDLEFSRTNCSCISTPSSMDAQIGLNVTPVDPKTVASEEWYGKESGKYTAKRSGISVAYNQLYPFEGLWNYTSAIIHHVRIDGLEPETKYYYKCGDSSLGEMSDEHSFVTLPLPSSVQVSFSDCSCWRLRTRKQFYHHHRSSHHERPFSAFDGWRSSTCKSVSDILTTGDKGASCYSFAFLDAPIRVNYQPRWDGWGRFIQPLAASVPMMVIEGNHEIEPQAADLTFMSCLTRFSVHAEESSSHINFYYSFDAGGIHFVMLGAYLDYNGTGDQYGWMEKDLMNVDRSTTPWLVAAWCSPWYNSYSSHYQDFECMRLQMEALLYQHGVDIVFSGHVCV